MKKIIFPLIVLATIAACNSAPKADSAETDDKKEAAAAEGTAFIIDSTTTIEWTGTKINGAHNGIFKIKEGSFSIKDNNLKAGSFVIDINSLNNIDLASDAGSKTKLEGHLKSADFFDAAIFPTAKFEITSVEPYDSTKAKDAVMKDASHLVKGNLTLKDSTKNISFPAKINITQDKVTATANFNIDRTEWGMNYKGPNSPQDWVIRKEVNLKLNIQATKK